jgi:transposase-like protein
VPRDETFSRESLAGTPLMASLPPPNTKRWVVRRKAAVVAAVHSGEITIEEACRVYQLSKEELLSWERAFEIHGLAGLRATRVQQYRRSRHARVPLGVAKPAS